MGGRTRRALFLVGWIPFGLLGTVFYHEIVSGFSGCDEQNVCSVGSNGICNALDK